MVFPNVVNYAIYYSVQLNMEESHIEKSLHGLQCFLSDLVFGT